MEAKKPNLVVTELDAIRLEELLANMPADASLIKKRLLSELDRADIVPSNEVSKQVVTMNSTVRFLIASKQEHFEYTLSYPQDVRDSSKQISILAPIGSALLGLSVGDELSGQRLREPLK